MTADTKKETHPDMLKACMSGAEQALFRKYVSQAKTVLEFGIGGSTGITSEYDHINLIGIDSHPDWIALCKKDPRIAALEARNQLTLRQVDIGPVGDWGFPSDPGSCSKWPRYSLEIWNHLGGKTPDFVFVDGRFRLSCAVQALLHLPNLKYLCMHDFWNREHYHPILDFVDVVEKVDLIGIFKPKATLDWRRLGILASEHLLDAR